MPDPTLEVCEACAGFGHTRKRPTQNELVLAVLQRRAGQWVPMPELVTASGAYAVHSRISNLREMGHTIEQKSERKGGKVHSSYRLLLPSTLREELEAQ